MYVKRDELDERARITDSGILKRFLFWGNVACVMLVSPSGKAHSYEVARPDRSTRFPDDVYFVYTIHEGTRFYTGMVERGEFRLTRMSRFLPDSEAAKGAKYLIRLASNQMLLASTPMAVYHNCVCPRCKRKLTSTYAIKQGYGRRCMRELQVKHVGSDK